MLFRSPGCTAGNCVTATNDGAYPYVFNNDLVDASFGVAAPIFLDELTPDGAVVNRIKVPTREMVTSFSSKSELALNDSLSGRAVTFMGYVAPKDGIDVSNTNTPGAPDPTNPDPGADFRAVAQLNDHGDFSFTETNAYSGNNGRAAILNDEPGADVYYTAGNAGNGANPQPDGVVLGAGGLVLFERTFGYRFQQYEVPFALPGLDFMLVAGVVSTTLCCLVGIIGAMLPAWRAGRAEPYALVRGEGS